VNGAPSGEQLEIARDDQYAVVTEVGGGLRCYTADGRDVIVGYDVDEMCSSGRGQVLAPWPNRIEDGTYEFGGRRHQLPLTEPDAHNAIHGLVRWNAWSLRERDPHRVVVEHELHPQPGYPFSLVLAIEYTLTASGLVVTTTATNVGRELCPFGLGAHPYLTLGRSIDGLALRVPARTVLHSDSRGLPRRATPVDDTEYDLRRTRPIGTTVLDHCYTDLDRGDDTRARIELTEPREERSITLWLDETYPYVMVFTGDPLPDMARRAVAIEPMTCPPNAFRSGVAVIELEPGASVIGSWGITPSATRSSQYISSAAKGSNLQGPP